MGIFDELKRMAHPFEDEDDDFEEFEAAAPRATERRERRDRYEQPERLERAGRNESYGGVNAMEEERRSNKVVNIRAATQLQVVLVKPDKFDDASAIADHLREKRTVVLNLESTNKEIARRLLDFLSGVAYANEGKIKKVAISTYIITPYNVDILGDLIDELENNGLYF
jgi:cell division inhibitor SepF